MNNETKKTLLVLKQSDLENLTESELLKLTGMHNEMAKLAPTPLPCKWLHNGKWLDVAPDVTRQVADYFRKIEEGQLVWSFGKTRSGL